MADTADWCRGRWHYLLPQFGIEEQFLRNEHGPCPLCGGKDRFRFDDKDGRGTWFCNACGNGDGFDLLTQFTGRTFKHIAEEIRSTHMGAAPERRETFQPQRTVEDKRESLNRVWAGATDMLHIDYLRHRGIDPQLLQGRLTDVRSIRKLFYQEGEHRSEHPAMVALVRDPNNEPISIHRTYLMPDGTRKKKLMPGVANVNGGAVRLIVPETNCLIVAEGIESALAGRQLIDATEGYGVWATVSARGMADLKIPGDLDHLIICADNDRSFTGQAAGYVLANRASTSKNPPKSITVVSAAKLGEDMVDLLKGKSQHIQVTVAR